MSQKEVVIASAARTPIGSFQGAFSSLSASDLGAIVVREAVRRAGAKADHVERVIMGNVLSAGMGQAPARQCVIKADFPVNVGAITLTRSTVSGNTTPSYGGGIYTTANLTLIDSVIDDNHSGDRGGGIMALQVPLVRIVGTTVSNNTSVSCGVSTEVGSSMISSFGFCNRQRMISTRCFSPTDSVCTARRGSIDRP